MDFLPAALAVSEPCSLSKRLDWLTYKRPQKSSMVCITAYERSTMRHILVDGIFFHNELGIKAGFCSRSCPPTRGTKTGTNNRLTVNSAMTVGCPVYEALVEIILSD